MIWLLPRSDPGATDTYLRPGGCGVSAPTGKLPYGRLPRLLMLWLYAEYAQGARADLERQYALGDYLLELEFEQPLESTDHVRRQPARGLLAHQCADGLTHLAGGHPMQVQPRNRRIEARTAPNVRRHHRRAEWRRRTRAAA